MHHNHCRFLPRLNTPTSAAVSEPAFRKNFWIIFLYSREGRCRLSAALTACDRIKLETELEVVGGDGFLGLTSPVALLSECRVSLRSRRFKRRTVSHKNLSGTRSGGIEPVQEINSKKGLEKPPRVKRTVLGRRIGAPTTPVPRWKVLSDKLDQVIAMAEKSAAMVSPVILPSPSARKLAASLLDVQDLPLSASFPACLYSPNWIPYNSSPPSATPLDCNSSPFSQPDYVFSPTSIKSGSHGHLKQTKAKRSVQTHSLQRLLTRTGMDTSDVTAHASIKDWQRHTPCSVLETTGEDEVRSGNNVTTSQELLKVFSQIRMLEEQHNQSLNITTTLHSELMQAHARVRKLELPDRMARQEVDALMKKFQEERMNWKMKEKEKVKAAVQSMKEELEEERKENNMLESANRRLTKELKEAQAGSAKALQELENERKSRQLMEEVCDELALETENEKAEVEEMKRQTQQIREELEEERRMLQLAEVWREERVQMKLSEARLELETKSAALDVMRAELESFLASKRNGGTFDNTNFRDAQFLHDVVGAVRHDTSITTFLPTPSISSISSNSSFPTTSDYMYGTTLDTDSSQESRDHEHSLMFYPEGIPDAD